jgi:hypothetical protein
MKIILDAGNACCHSVQNILPSRLLSETIKITTVFLVVLYGCETWFLTLREEHRVFGNRVLRRISGVKGDELTGWRKLRNKKFHN